jgi:hypothetical protein
MIHRISAFATVVGMAVFAGTSAGAVTLEAGGLRIAEPGSVVNGRSIGNMTAEWWRFVLETPQTLNPVFGGPYVPGPLTDEGTYFLYGFPNDNSGTQQARVKPGSALLLPMRNSANLKTEPDETAQDLLDQIDPSVGSIRNLSVSVNGVDVASENGVDLIADFREQFPSQPGDVTFGVDMPEEDAAFGLDGFSTDLIVADGHWMLFDDLRAGEHTIMTSYDVVNDEGVITDSVRVTQLVAAVPLPAPIGLLGAGMMALLAIRRRTASSSTTVRT